MSALAVLIILALILIPWFYAQAKWKVIRPRDIHTSLTPQQLRNAFESKVVGSTWKVHDAGNPMVAISRLLGGIRQQLSLGIVETESGTSARIAVARVTFKLTGPSKAYTLQMRMSAFIAEVQRLDRSARIVDRPVDKRLQCGPFPESGDAVQRQTASPSPVANFLDQAPVASADQPTVPDDEAEFRLDDSCSVADCMQPAPAGGMCILHQVRASNDGSGASEAVAEGWYPDPRGHAQLRWWDGSAWTDNVHDSAS